MSTKGTEALTGQQIAEAGLERWTLLVYYGRGELTTRIHTRHFATGRRLVDAIGAAAEALDHHADLDLRASWVDVRLGSAGAAADAGGVTDLDLRLARRITDLAAAAGAELECRSLTRMELGLDTPDHARIAPFWAAVLGRQYVTGDSSGGWADVGDPHRVLPLIYFGRPDREAPQQRWHPDVWVDPAQARPRIDAALAAGGTVVSDAHAPTFWVLADPDGNKVGLYTWLPGDTVIG
jgi:4a-hydroxytetrahydrobiopterin dehydratase